MSGQEAGQKKKGFHWPHFKAAPGSEAELERVSQRASSLGRRCAPAWLLQCCRRRSRLPPPRQQMPQAGSFFVASPPARSHIRLVICFL